MYRLSLLLSFLVLPLVATSPVSANPLPEVSHEATPLMRQETSLMIQMLEHQHIKNERLENFAGEEIIEQFMAAVDSQRLFFTKDDHQLLIDELAGGIVRNLRVGELNPLFQIHALYHQRAKDRLELITGRLSRPFDFDSDKTFSPDRRKSDWAEAGEEIEDLWERRLH